MLVPLSWLSEFVAVPAGTTPADLAAALVRAGLEVETLTHVGGDVREVVVGEVVEFTDLDEFAKPIRACQVRVAGGEPRGIVCGARNFVVGDRVAVALPGAVLPGGVQIGARRTYGRMSDGMICSARELGVGEDHRGILVLPPDTPIGAGVAELLHLRDVVLDVAVTPDRGYCLSIRGIARETATAFGVDFSDPAGALPAVWAEPAEGLADPYPCAIEDAGAADRLLLRSVRGLDPTRRTPLEIARRLHLVGIRPVALAVDVTNYVMHECGQPLHAFDRRRLTGPVVVRRSRKGERLTTLDHVERTLHADDLLIADDSGPLSLAGMMGGLTSEVRPDTVDLVIEAAHFSATATAAMSRRHGLSSEASRRFERGVDPALPPAASARAVQLLVEYGGGTYVGSAEVDLDRPVAHVALPADLPGRLAGVRYARSTVIGRLLDVGCAVTGEDELSVTPPSWRPDLVDPYDLVEEVVRLEGYDAVPSVLPRAPAGRGLTAGQRDRRTVSRALAAAGYVEVVSYPFHSAGVLDALDVPAGDDRRRLAGLANPLSEQAGFLRSTLLPGLLDVLRRNVSRGIADVAVFEMGAVFLDRPGSPAPRPAVTARPSAAELAALDGALPEQPLHVAVVVAGAREPRGWWGPARP
ncbi:MAG: phenylalanine--tRNA ligase subunit beta, partial [Actinomycetota bacterium]|nr:phenylalanine--tRNA ligase subunit beta [Actinomycetota bacterium]